MAPTRGLATDTQNVRTDMTALEITETIQNGVLKVVETGQAWTLGAVRSTTGAFDGMVPDPTWMPLADRLPTPKDAIDQSFTFAERVLEAQRSFLTELVGILPGAPAPAAAPAKKTTAA